MTSVTILLLPHSFLVKGRITWCQINRHDAAECVLNATKKKRSNNKEELKLFRVGRHYLEREDLYFGAGEVAMSVSFSMTLIKMKSCNTLCVCSWQGKAWTSKLIWFFILWNLPCLTSLVHIIVGGILLLPRKLFVHLQRRIIKCQSKKQYIVSIGLILFFFSV